MRSLPPSALPGISPSRGRSTCGKASLHSNLADEAMWRVLPISPLEGEMSGRTEGGARTLQRLHSSKPKGKQQ
ncbi:propionyl-coenzyme A carboxylase alpha polypeptide [Agrobacterium tumefaciens]|nr:propionyl-coenzyme A carboxylase alpha polypeptide [Agrobacterium tumefaciens]NTD12639.1 propionyl-coenzyme A carboxylase alpha polypeptide [Agrobacterium tumefaciens]